MAAERAECQERSRPGLGPEAMDKNEKEVSLQEELSADTNPGPETERPYSIYTLREKWFIVSMASLAAFFR